MASPDGSGFQRKRVILCIDDSEPVLYMLNAFLSHLGYSVLTASTGESALKLFLNNHIDAVITDYEFGQVKGEEVIRSLRTLKSHTPILLFSACEDIPDSVRSIADSCVYKTNVRALVSEISDLLNSV